MLDTATDEQLGGSPAEKGLTVPVAAGSAWASHVPWQPGAPAASRAALNTAWIPVKGGDSLTIFRIVLLWCSLTSNTKCSSGLQNSERTLKDVDVSRGVRQSWWQGWEAFHLRGKRGWAHWGCPEKRRLRGEIITVLRQLDNVMTLYVPCNWLIPFHSVVFNFTIISKVNPSGIYGTAI